MRTTILATAVLLLMLSASAVYAQRVELALDNNEHPVINCDGMSSEAYTTTPKGYTEAILKTEKANATVYKRFAVHKSDYSSLSTWFEAFTVCSNIGENWRLPTQRELMLMWVLKDELKNSTSDFIQFDTHGYWSATESSFTTSWNVSFGNGASYYNDYYAKTKSYKVRCIRELGP